MKASLFLLATLPMIFADEDFKCSMGLRGADVQASTTTFSTHLAVPIQVFKIGAHQFCVVRAVHVFGETWGV